MTLSVIATSVLLLLQTTKGSVEGTVVNAITNAPIAGAQVSGTRMPTPTGVPEASAKRTITGVLGGVVTPSVVVDRSGAQFGPPAQVAPVRTDANGHFIIRDLDPGSYVLRAAAEGYAQQESSTRPGQSGLTQLSLSSGDMAKATFRLTPGGTVSGRVTGSRGEPLVNLEVSLFRNVYSPDGNKNVQQSGTTTTNDRGEYRLFWITPGRYYLSAASSNRPLPGMPFNPAFVMNRYPRTFFPSSTDIASALPVDIQPAVELSGVDFRLNEQSTYRIRGRVADPPSGLSVRSASISIMSIDSGINGPMLSTGNSYNGADGTFEFRDVASGSYIVRVQLAMTSRPEPGQPPVMPPAAMARVDVAGDDVDGIVLNFVSPISISGRVQFDGASTSEGLRGNVMLRPIGVALMGGVRPATVNPDGSFVIDGVSLGEYQVIASIGNQPGAYIKQIRLGSLDLSGKSLTVEGPISQSLNILAAKTEAQVSGAVRGNSQQLIPDAQVALIPDQRDRHDFYRFMNTDASGRFTLRFVPPGSYRIFAWEDIEPFSWFDSKVLSSFESRGLPVTINESGNATFDVTVIPAARPQ